MSDNTFIRLPNGRVVGRRHVRFVDDPYKSVNDQWCTMVRLGMDFLCVAVEYPTEEEAIKGREKIENMLMDTDISACDHEWGIDPVDLGIKDGPFRAVCMKCGEEPKS